MPVYKKLVRDKIPEIIAKEGKEFSTKILSKEEYVSSVNEKMEEELDEYLQAETNVEAVEELADLLELIHAASSALGANIEEVEKVRKEKAIKRGGFEDRIFLIDVEDD